MLGVCGELTVANSDLTTNIVGLIEAQEIGYGQTTLSMLKNSGRTFAIKKAGIRVEDDCTITINENRDFSLVAGEVLEFPYDMFNIYSIKSKTEGVTITIRYLY